MRDKVLISILVGKGTKLQHGIYLCSLFFYLAIMFLLAQSVFPGEYSPLVNHISDQGGIADNPKGHIYFIIGVGMTGFLLIPHFLYLYRNFMPTTKLLTFITCLLGIVGAIAFSFVGLIPEDFEQPHSNFADIAFGSLSICMLLSFFILLRKVHLKEPWPNLKEVIIIYSIIFGLIGLIITFPSVSYNENWNIDPRLFTWPPWQWTGLVTIILWILLIFLIIPDNTKKEE